MKDNDFFGVKKYNGQYQAFIFYRGNKYTSNYESEELAKLRRLTWELTYFGERATQIRLIKSEYPYLLGYLQVCDFMNFNDDMETIRDIGKRLITDPHCPCMVKKIPETVCPCLPCRTKQRCCCEMYKAKENKN